MNIITNVYEWVKKVLFNLRKISKTESEEVPSIQEHISHAGFCFLMEVIARNDIVEICNAASQLKQGQNSFWASVEPSDEIFLISSGKVPLIINKLTDITNELMTGVEISDKETQKEFDLMDRSLKTKINTIKALKKVLLVGDGAFFLYVRKGQIKYKFLAGRNVEYVYDSFGELQEIIALKSYEEKSGNYLLKERYGKGFIKYELYNEAGGRVPLSRVPEIADLQDIEFKDENGEYIDQIFAIKFQVYDSDKYENRGGSIFENKLDYLDALDEILSMRETDLRNAHGRLLLPSIFIARDENGRIKTKKTVFNTYFETGVTDTEKAKVESIQFDIRSDEYRKTEEDMEDHIYAGIIDKSSFTHGVTVNNTEIAIQNEQITIKTSNSIKVAIQETIPELIYAILYLQSLINGKTLNVEKEDIKVNIEEYGNPSFENQVDMTVKLNGLIPDYERLKIFYGNTKTDEEIRKICEDLQKEKAGINFKDINNMYLQQQRKNTENIEENKEDKTA